MIINLKEVENLAISPEIPILGEVAHIKQIGNKILVNLGFYDDATSEQIEYLIDARYPGIKVEVTCQTEPKTAQPNVAVKKNINNIISQPTMLGIHDAPELIGEKLMRPNVAHGVESNSIGYLVDGETAMIWRAPMIVGALNQLINDTAWGSSFETYGKGLVSSKACLDYLFIDLPPGTGDIALTMAQKIPVTGAVTVTTPQDIALIDAKRAIKMFEKMQIDNFGIVENMNTHICEKCGHESHIFGQHGGRGMAKAFNVPFLGEIPLDISLRESLDKGQPIVAADPEHPISQRYRDIARKIAIQAAKKPKSFSQAFGNIAIENG